MSLIFGAMLTIIRYMIVPTYIQTWESSPTHTCTHPLIAMLLFFLYFGALKLKALEAIRPTTTTTTMMMRSTANIVKMCYACSDSGTNKHWNFFISHLYNVWMRWLFKPLYSILPATRISILVMEQKSKTQFSHWIKWICYFIWNGSKWNWRKLEQKAHTPIPRPLGLQCNNKFLWHFLVIRFSFFTLHHLSPPFLFSTSHSHTGSIIVSLSSSLTLNLT